MDPETGPIILTILSGVLAGDLIGDIRIKLEEKKWDDDRDE